MLYLKSFCFNPFQENTYVLFDDEKNCFIIDPGNHSDEENKMLTGFLQSKNLRPQRLLLTHGHIDHILGNRFVFDTFKLLPEVHREDLFFIERMPQSASLYGLKSEVSPLPENFIEAGKNISLGKYKIDVLHVPGHSPGSVAFFNRENKILISGDVLFYQSIGRSDLPMGNHDQLINSITTTLFPLGDDVKVFSGHGPSTSIGFEKENNPFIN